MEGLKNFIYAGIGLATTTSEKVKTTVDELVEKGKISDTEGKKIVEDFFKSTGEMKEDFESRLKKFSDELTDKYETLKKNNTVIDTLEDKIKELESKLKGATEKVKNAIKNTSEEVKETAEETVSKVKATAKKTTKEAVKAAKKTVKKATK
jgi:polyhydroxyalkanoate synthesis regulator phasin